jgi:glucokinase
MKSSKSSYPRLVADIGGTNARFSIEVSQFKYEHTKVLNCIEYKSLADAVIAYLKDLPLTKNVEYACMAVPGPILDDELFMVNSPWHRELITNIEKTLKLKKVIFINDFHALALAIPHIKKDKLVKLGGTNEVDYNKPMAIIGPGTGLGMAALIRHRSGDYIAISAEGGRASFPPATEEEIDLWKFASSRFQHVSAERFLCGNGLQFIYEGLCKFSNRSIYKIPTPAEIVELGSKRLDYVCTRTLETFCRMLGTVTSNFVVSINAFGGVYIAGGIVPKMLDFFMNSNFRIRFESKGRFHSHLAQIPINIIIDEFPAFLGTSYALDTYLNYDYIP